MVKPELQESIDEKPSSLKAAITKPAVKRKAFRFVQPAAGAEKNNWTRTSYFEARQKKLTSQAPVAETSVLKGVTVYFTGLKTHSQRKMEALVWRNGGIVQKVWLRRRVTHVIADNLAASKVEKELQLDVKNAAVVVRPTWILESLKKGERLPTWDFRVVRSPPGVKDVASYFKKGQRRTKQPQDGPPRL